MSSVRTSSSSVEHADNEKAQHLKVVTYDKSIVDDDEYDLDDPKNYSTNYVDEYNPRGLSFLLFSYWYLVEFHSKTFA